ncbi:MAG TPA: hypothetical protein VHU41_04540, partial [Thermoanaerobaculia bacterium]|nr:hypothetical protein [Thermoanaerobaculia bacterium]
DPHRCARLVEFHAENAANPAMSDVTNRLIDVAMESGGGYDAAVTRATRTMLVTKLMALAASDTDDPQVRAEAAYSLHKLATRLAAPFQGEEIEAAHRRATHDDIEKFLSRTDRKFPTPPEVPPGPPIGD